MKAYLSKHWPQLAVALALIGLVNFGLIDAATAAMGGAGLMMLSFETVAGSTLSVSVSAPATYDNAGYGALTWTAVGEITDLGSGLGRDYNTTTHSPVATRQQIEKKASYKLGELALVMAWDHNDAGQTILRTASQDDSIISVKIVKQGGDVRYFTAQVKNFLEDFGTVDNVNQGKCSLLRQKDIVYNPA